MAPRQRSLGRNGTDETSSFVDESSGAGSTGSGGGGTSATSPLVISSSSSSSSIGSDSRQHNQKQKGDKGGGVRRPRDPPPTTLDLTEADIERIRHDYFNLVALVRRMCRWFFLFRGLSKLVSRTPLPFFNFVVSFLLVESTNHTELTKLFFFARLSCRLHSFQSTSFLPTKTKIKKIRH